MKLSKLDPMTALMLVVAFGVVVTMLSQNSVASVDAASVNAKQTSDELRVTAVQVDVKNGSATKLSKATFY